MIPPTTIELKQHSDNLTHFGKSLHNLDVAGKSLVHAVVIVIALMAVVTFLPPMVAVIV